MTAFSLNSYDEQTFTQLTLKEDCIANIEFQNCQFKQCQFLGVNFTKVRFIDCDFESCDLSLSKFSGCRFSEVSFRRCKLVGLNWTELSWPLVKLASPLYFYDSNLSHSSFFGLSLPDLIIENCKAHDVDFRETQLNHASFVGTDLMKSLFVHSNLKGTNFTNAINYNIDIRVNTISKAVFSFPEAIALLNHLDIEIIGWPNDEDI
ncbi:MAG: pentapeptide repeat-containing protein [Tatlockia sp.]|nr:pentapeptide repeat-containing protein [Tatlockia sp.]